MRERSFCAECKLTEMGHEYMGTLNTTDSGKTCQAWSSNSPHIPATYQDTQFPDGSRAAALNYCRNPDSEPSPWCYTTDPNTRWEYCDVPFCPGKCKKSWSVSNEENTDRYNKLIALLVSFQHQVQQSFYPETFTFFAIHDANFIQLFIPVIHVIDNIFIILKCLPTKGTFPISEWVEVRWRHVWRMWLVTQYFESPPANSGCVHWLI